MAKKTKKLPENNKLLAGLRNAYKLMMAGRCTEAYNIVLSAAYLTAKQEKPPVALVKGLKIMRDVFPGKCICPTKKVPTKSFEED